MLNFCCYSGNSAFLLRILEKYTGTNSLNLLNRRKFEAERELRQQKEGITKDNHTG